MKCGRICLSHGGQLPVLNRRKGSQHFMNQAKFHSTFPTLVILKSLQLTNVSKVYKIKNDFNDNIISIIHQNLKFCGTYVFRLGLDIDKMIMYFIYNIFSFHD